MSLHTIQSADKASMKDYHDPREQPVSERLSLDDAAADMRRAAKLDLIQMVDDCGVAATRAMLPKLGMTEHYGLETVTIWLNGIAASIRK